jgi:hypothetical protein
VDLYAPSWQPQRQVFSAYGLGEGPHVLRIEVTGGRNPSSTSNTIEVDAIEAADVWTLSRFEETDEAFVFSSGWWRRELSSRSGGAAMLARDAGEVVDIGFTGPVVHWIASYGPGLGVARVWINGEDHRNAQ